MRTHIDWVSFTIPMVYDTEDGDNYARAIHAGFLYLFAGDLVASVFGGAWRTGEKSRAPYKDVWVDRENGLSLFGSPNLTHATVEISGQGCERLIATGQMEQVLAGCAERITRIDVACDIETETMPLDFVAQRDHERMRSNGMMNSDTGETCYIGSKQSERFARVYRYFPPHPRSHLLRVEHVFRRDYAKQVARSILENDLSSVANAAGKAFGWVHPIWNVGDALEVDISITSPERNAGKTVSWLVRSVAPAVQRLIRDGTIRDPQAFFRTYFLPEDGSMLD
jgi:DNA relaxase NicK